MQVGSRLRSTVCATEVIVVRAPDGDATLCCGGAPMARPEEVEGGSFAGGTLDPGHAAGTQVGKRYGSEGAGLEVLCTKGGEGSLSFGGVALAVQEAKHLPSSD